MGFRTIVINSKCKLEYSLNYLVCRSDQVKRVLIDEISTVIIQNTCVSLTSALLCELVKNKIKVIFCDEKSNPLSELLPYSSSYASSSRIKEQIKWKTERFDILWQKITKQKILNQAKNLKDHGKLEEFQMLITYASEVQKGDMTNREGHAAKVYFNALFGKDFSRGNPTLEINAFLNYGYSIILSAINREITAYGYLTQLGIHHIGETNPFNLSCDLIEPLRPLIDKIAMRETTDTNNFKSIMSKVLTENCIYGEIETYLDNAIHLYIRDLLAFLNDKSDDVEFIQY